MAVQKANYIWRDFKTDGVPASGKNKPSKRQIRERETWVENAINAGLSNGGLIYDTKANMDADLAHDANASAWVIADGTVANNGIYRKNGASGSGSWTRIGDLPYSFIKASNAGAGTANAIQATTSIPIPAGDGAALITLNITANNTGAATVSFNGGAALTIKTASGADVQADYLVAGAVVSGYVVGSTFQLTSEVGTAAAAAAAQAAADAATAAAAGVVSTQKSRAYAMASYHPDVAPDFIQTAGWALPGDGGAALYKQVAAEPSHEGKFPLELGDGVTVVWFELTDVVPNVLQFGADATGADGSSDAFSKAAQFAFSNTVRISLYENLPLAPVANVIVPAGLWKLDEWVDTGGANVTWLVDDAAQFDSDCAAFLTGRIHRGARVDFASPYGALDNACGFAVIAGMRKFSVHTPVGDRPAGVSGYLNPKQIGAGNNGPGGVVGFYAEASTVPPLAISTSATYGSSTIVTLPLADVEKRRLRKGLFMEIGNGPPSYRAMLDSWSDDGNTLTLVTTGWRAIGAAEADPDSIPPDDGTTLYIGTTTKSWATNFNIVLNANSNDPPQGVAGEIGVFNYRVSPASFDNADGYAWGWDVANVGQYKLSNFYQARGAGFTGYLSSSVDVGFRCAAFLSYTLPATGFRYEGSGIAFSKTNASSVVDVQITNGTIELGAQGASNTPVIDFHSGATNVDYDARISVTGGDGSIGHGAISITANTLVTPALRPSADNTLALGNASFRWSTVYAGTGTINTSDPKLKTFLDDDMEPLKRAVKRLKVKAFQWKDVVAQKGNDARIHIGFSAQDVLDAFEAEGLDARRYALFCEDDEVEHVEVIDYIEVPEMEDFEEEYTDREVRDDGIYLVKKTRTAQRPRVVELPVLNEDGTRAMQEKGVLDADGNVVRDGRNRPIVQQVAAVAPVPVMRKKEVRTIEARPTGGKTMGLRYDQLMLLMLADG